VLDPILLIVGFVSPAGIMWAIGLTLLMAGIVLLVASERSRAASGRKYRY
jgi:hypothetical protein